MTQTSHDVHWPPLIELVSSLGAHGGIVSPSIYDTAQYLRFSPGAIVHQDALQWLADQQNANGSWGWDASPLARDVATLAVILTLQQYEPNLYAESIRTGLAYLRRVANHWQPPLRDDIPGSVELLLPRLLLEAQASQLDVDLAPYQALMTLGQKRQKIIERLPVVAGTTAAHAWEGWGTQATEQALDPSGGVGHSPAASAAWLRAAENQPHLFHTHSRVEEYLEQASAATMSSVPGLMPTAWPIDRFEQVFGLYALFLGNQLNAAELRSAVQPQLRSLSIALGPNGIGMSDFFQPDGDDTAAAVAVLIGAGYSVAPSILDHFAETDHYHTWPHEMQPSLSVTAHAVHALSLMGYAPPAACAYLIDRQHADGSWHGDKWNGSWLYTTSQVMFALHHAGYTEAVLHGLKALLAAQQYDGGWGMFESTAEETAYVQLILSHLERHGLASGELIASRQRGRAWLRAQGSNPALPARWFGKEPYVPVRVAQMFICAALG